MYKFIFYYFYTIYKKRKDNGEKLSACMFTWAAQFLHLCLIYAIIKYIYFIDTNKVLPTYNFSNFYFYNKVYMAIFIAIPWIVILYRYYSQERISKIEQKYSGVKILTFKNFSKMLLIIIGPLLIVIRIAIIT